MGHSYVDQISVNQMFFDREAWSQSQFPKLAALVKKEISQ
jgi:hypothetical protein